MKIEYYEAKKIGYLFTPERTAGSLSIFYPSSKPMKYSSSYNNLLFGKPKYNATTPSYPIRKPLLYGTTKYKPTGYKAAGTAYNSILGKPYKSKAYKEPGYPKYPKPKPYKTGYGGRKTYYPINGYPGDPYYPKPIPDYPDDPIIIIHKKKPKKKFFKPKELLFGKGYLVLVRGKGYKVKGKFKPGKWIKGSPFALTKQSALSLGARITSKTEKRSFKLLEVGKVPVRKEIKGWETLAPQFRKAKRGDYFVERTRFAINTPGELLGITQKGIEAKKRQSNLGSGAIFRALKPNKRRKKKVKRRKKA